MYLKVIRFVSENLFEKPYILSIKDKLEAPLPAFANISPINGQRNVSDLLIFLHFPRAETQP